MSIVPVTNLQFVDQFLSNFVSENTRISYRRDLEDYARFTSTFDPFNLATLIAYRDHVASASASATVIRKLSSVKSFMSFLAGQGLLKFNPASDLRMPKSVTEEETEAFSDEEAKAMIASPDTSTFAGSTHRLVLLMLLNLGLRRSELANLRLSDVCEHRGVRYINVIGKGQKPRVVPVSEKLHQEITSYAERFNLTVVDYLIQSSERDTNQKPTSPSTIYRIVRRYATKIGIQKRVSPHSCRATLISHLLEKNVSPRHVADLVGHRSITTTVDIYDRKRDALTNPAATKVDYGS